MIIVTQCIIKYAFFSHFNIETRLGGLDFIFLIFATVFIAAGGYIINDIYDIEADKINKPTKCIVNVRMSLKNTRTLYYTFTVIGLAFGFMVSTIISKPLYIIYFIGVSVCLYIYSRDLKTIPLLGNVLVSILVGASILIVGVFDLFPLQNPVNSKGQLTVFYILKDIALFAFLINFLREIVKDIEDLQGDYTAQYRTLPIIFGTKRTARITASIGLICMFIISTYIFTYLGNHTIAIIIAFVLIIAPLAYACILLWDASTKKEFSKISFLLKIIMFIGISIIPFISKFIDHAI